MTQPANKAIRYGRPSATAKNSDTPVVASTGPTSQRRHSDVKTAHDSGVNR